jgi:hypothetical protein
LHRHQGGPTLSPSDSGPGNIKMLTLQVELQSKSARVPESHKQVKA